MTGTGDVREKTDRRARVHHATLVEIKAAARGLLVQRGPEAVTMNAIARAIGVSGPALYHYFENHEALVAALCADFYNELAEAMEGARDADPGASLRDRFLDTCRAMRQWAVAHPAEFQWVFIKAAPASSRLPSSVYHLASRRFGGVLLGVVADIWAERPFEAPRIEEMPAGAIAELEAYAASTGHQLPAGAIIAYLDCWVRLYGLLCLEVLHQLDFATNDMEPFYEQTLRSLVQAFGLDCA